MFCPLVAGGTPVSPYGKRWHLPFLLNPPLCCRIRSTGRLESRRAQALLCSEWFLSSRWSSKLFAFQQVALQLLWSDFISIVSSSQEQSPLCSSPSSVKPVHAELVPLVGSGQSLNQREQVKRTKEPVSKLCGGVWEGKEQSSLPWRLGQKLPVEWLGLNSVVRAVLTFLWVFLTCGRMVRAPMFRCFRLSPWRLAEMPDEPRNLTRLGWQLFCFPTQYLPYLCVIAVGPRARSASLPVFMQYLPYGHLCHWEPVW